MATARLSHKRSYDDFLEPYGGFGYNAHAGRNVQAWKPEMMDVMDEVVPAAKKSKFLLHDEESAQSSTPSTQATIAAKISESLPKLTRTDERTFSNSGNQRKWPLKTPHLYLLLTYFF